MPLKLTKRGDIWYVRGSINNHFGRARVYESTGLADPVLAEAYRVRRENEIAHGLVYGARAVVTFAQAALSYIEHNKPSERDAAFIRRLVEWFKTSRLSEIDQAAVDVAAAKLCRLGATDATKLRSVYVPVRAILMHAAKRKWCERPMLDTPKQSRSRTDWLTPAQARALLEAAAFHVKPLLTFLLGTGCRVGEAIGLEWSDVDLTAGTVIFRETKNGKDRITNLPPTSIVALANLPHREGRVFRVQRDKRMAALGLLPPPYAGRTGQFKRAWAGACKRARLVDDAGVALMSPHALRHTWATWFFSATKNPLRLMHEGGWSSMSLVERYAHLMSSDLIPEISSVWGVAHPDDFPAAKRAPSVQPEIEIKNSAGESAS